MRLAIESFLIGFLGAAFESPQFDSIDFSAFVSIEGQWGLSTTAARGRLTRSQPSDGTMANPCARNNTP